MGRIIARSFGDPAQVLGYEPSAMPIAEAGCALVRMSASPINPSDLIPVTGAYAHRTALPFIPGFEGVGVVERVGDGVDPQLIGQRVLPLGSAGCWQTWKALPADWCIAVPDDIGDDAAATAYINPLTALLMVDAIAPSTGDHVGITAAGSSIGRILIRMLAAAGARPIAIVRSQATLDLLRDEPAELVMEGKVLPRLQAGLDALGGLSGARLAAAIRPGGPLLHYGLLSGQPLTDVGTASLTLFRLREVVHAIPRAAFHTAMQRCFAAIRTGHAATPVAGRYPLASYRDALAHDARGGRRGKVLLLPQA